MPTIQGSLNLSGATTVENVLAGSAFEFLPFDAMLEMAITAETGAAIGDLVYDVYSGADILMEGGTLLNTGPPKADQDLFLEDEAVAGDRLKIRVRNTTAATARRIFWLVKITPI